MEGLDEDYAFLPFQNRDPTSLCFTFKKWKTATEKSDDKLFVTGKGIFSRTQICCLPQTSEGPGKNTAESGKEHRAVDFRLVPFSKPGMSHVPGLSKHWSTSGVLSF